MCLLTQNSSWNLKNIHIQFKRYNFEKILFYFKNVFKHLRFFFLTSAGLLILKTWLCSYFILSRMLYLYIPTDSGYMKNTLPNPPVVPCCLPDRRSLHPMTDTIIQYVFLLTARGITILRKVLFMFGYFLVIADIRLHNMINILYISSSFL